MAALPSDCIPPTYLFEQLERVMQGRRKGYVMLAGPVGAGKTIAMQTLAEAGEWNGATVLAQFLPGRPGLTAADLLDDLAAQIRSRWPVTLPATYSITIDFDFVAKLLPRVLRALMLARGLRTLVLIIDGIDDPRVSADVVAQVATILPPAHLLPDGCFVVLTTGTELQPTLKEELDRIKDGIAPYLGGNTDSSGGEALPLCFETVSLSPTAEENRALLRAYPRANLPEPLRTPEQIETVLGRSAGLFVYARHFCAALRAGLFSMPDDLPEAAAFFEVYLNRLSDRVGQETFASVYEPLLGLLAAAALPVTAQQLVRWGVPADGLPAALNALQDFLTVEAGAGERGSIAHGSFTAYLWKAHEASVRAAHGAIARAALASIVADEDAELDPYELEFAYRHAA
ncbi:MAG: ATP-binding protein, partial [Dehalococcoidia bacterium]